MLVKAIQIAKRSTIKRHKTGAVIVGRNGSIVSTGWSHMTEVNRTQYYSMHAELHAILRAPTKDSLKGATIYVATVSGNKNGGITSGKPCKACESVIRSVGIKSIVYTEREDYGSNKAAGMVNHRRKTDGARR